MIIKMWRYQARAKKVAGGATAQNLAFGTHQDTDHLHDHGLIVSFLADTNEPVAFGEGWWKEKAKSWQEVHKRLAGIGYRYVKVGNTGVLEAVTVAGRWSECEGLRCGAGDAYANAALGKLSKRLKADYVPPAPDLAVRAFVTPCYNAPEKADAADQAARKEELSEYKALVEGLETDYKARYNKKLVAEKGDNANAARTRERVPHRGCALRYLVR